jgi:integrase
VHPLARSLALARRAKVSTDRRMLHRATLAEREPFRCLARLRVRVLTKRSRRHDADGRKDLRDRALLLIGFADGLRRSELATINLVDFERVREGIILTIRWSKTDQDGVGRKIGIGNVMSCFLLVNRARCPSARMSKSIICGCVVGLKLPKKSLYWANVTMPQSLVRERS